jgi:predicted ArsR family transcriptional regulator
MTGDRRSQVLALVREAPTPMTIADVADRLGIHLNTARFHLDALAAADLVERVRLPRTGPGRPAFAFRARRRMDPGGPRRYELLAGVLVRELAASRDGARRAADAGRAWGRSLLADERTEPQAGPADRTDRGTDRGTDRTTDRATDRATDRLVELLDEFGFAPERRTAHGEQQIALRHCPFLELAEDARQVVCPVHLGLMQGAMEQLSDEVSVESLEPFAEPDLCLTHLGVR